MYVNRVFGRRGERLAAVLGAITMFVSLVPPASGAAPRALSTFSATDCREIGSFFFLPMEELDPYVPDELTVAPVHAGLGEVLVLTTRCDTLIAGKPRRQAMFSEVGIYVESADDSPSWHYYGLWHATSHKQLSRALARLGVKAPFVGDMSFSSSTGVVDANASVPLRKGAYEVQALVPAPPFLYGARPSTWWYKTRGGFVRIVYAISSYSGRSGTGQLKTEPGTPLADLLGTPNRPTNSTIVEDYPELTATVTRVDL